MSVGYSRLFSLDYDSTSTTTTWYLPMTNYSGSIIIAQYNSSGDIIGTGTWNDVSSISTSTTGQYFVDISDNLLIQYNTLDTGNYGFTFINVNLTLFGLYVTFSGIAIPSQVQDFTTTNPASESTTVTLTQSIASGLSSQSYLDIFYYLPLSCDGQITIIQTSTNGTVLSTNTWDINTATTSITFPSIYGQNFNFTANTNSSTSNNGSSSMLVNYNFAGDSYGLVFSNVDLTSYTVSVTYTPLSGNPFFSLQNSASLNFSLNTGASFNVYYYQNQTTSFFFENIDTYTDGALSLLTNGWMVPYILPPSTDIIQNTLNNTYLIGAGIYDVTSSTGGQGGNSCYLDASYVYIDTSASINPVGGTTSTSTSSLLYSTLAYTDSTNVLYNVTTNLSGTTYTNWPGIAGAFGGSSESGTAGGGGGASGYSVGSTGGTGTVGAAAATYIYYTTDVSGNQANSNYGAQTTSRSTAIIGQAGSLGSDGSSPIGGVGGGAQTASNNASNGGVIVTLLGYWTLSSDPTPGTVTSTLTVDTASPTIAYQDETYLNIFYYLQLSCNGSITVNQISTTSPYETLSTVTYNNINTSSTTAVSFDTTSGTFDSTSFTQNSITTSTGTQMLVNYNFVGDSYGLVFSNVDLTLYTVSVIYTPSVGDTAAIFSIQNPAPSLNFSIETDVSFNVYYYQNQTTTFYFTNTTSLGNVLNLLNNSWMVPYSTSTGIIQNTGNNTYLIGAGTYYSESNVGGDGGNACYLYDTYMYVPTSSGSVNSFNSTIGFTTTSSLPSNDSIMTYATTTGTTIASTDTTNFTAGWNQTTGGQPESGYSGSGGGGAAGYVNGGGGSQSNGGLAAATYIYSTNSTTYPTYPLSTTYSVDSTTIIDTTIVGQDGGNGTGPGTDPTVGGYGGGGQTVTGNGIANGGIVLTLLGYWTMTPTVTSTLTSALVPTVTDDSIYPYIFYYLPLSCDNTSITINQIEISSGQTIGTGTWTVTTTSTTTTTTFPSTSGQLFAFQTPNSYGPANSVMLVNYNFAGDSHGLVFSSVDLATYNVTVTYTSTTDSAADFTYINPAPSLTFSLFNSTAFDVYYYQNQTTTLFFTSEASAGISLKNSAWMAPYTLPATSTEPPADTIQNTGNNTYLIGAGIQGFINNNGNFGGQGGDSSFLNANYVNLESSAPINAVSGISQTYGYTDASLNSTLTYYTSSGSTNTAVTDSSSIQPSSFIYMAGGSGSTSTNGTYGGNGGGAAGYTAGGAAPATYGLGGGTASPTYINFTNTVTSADLTTTNYTPQTSTAGQVVIGQAGQEGGNASTGGDTPPPGTGGGAQQATSTSAPSDGGVVVTLLGYWTLYSS